MLSFFEQIVCVIGVLIGIRAYDIRDSIFTKIIVNAIFAMSLLLLVKQS